MPHQLAFVTDDNLVNRKLACAFLQRLGWRVEEFPDAPAMLARFDQQPPTVVLLDISMPGMSGTEACARLRALPGADKLRIVAYTAHALPQEHEQFLAAGFDAVLVKPLTLASITDIVGPANGTST